MIKNIKITNYKLFEKQVEISFSNHGHQKHAGDFVLKNNISSIAGIIGKNASGKTTVIDAINFYASLKGSSFIHDILIKCINKELAKKVDIARRDGRLELLKEHDSVADAVFSGGEIDAGLLEKYSKEIEEVFKAVFINNVNNIMEPIKFEFEFVEKEEVSLIQEFEISNYKIKEVISLKRDGQLEIISEVDAPVFAFKSRIMEFIKKNNIVSSALDKISYRNFISDGSVKKIVIKNNLKEKLLSFVRIADDNIQGFTYDKVGHIVSFQDKRMGRDINPRYLSDGTKHLIYMFNHVYSAIFERKTFLLIDEIENSLHLELIKFIVTLFKKDYNKYNSQLLFTTHNPLVFEQDFKKNSIYFIRDKKIVRNEMRYDKKITPGYLKGELVSNPDYKYRFDFLEKIVNGK